VSLLSNLVTVLFCSSFQISVVSVVLHGIEASVVVNNRDIAVDAVVSDLALKERGNMSFEKYQEFFISGLLTNRLYFFDTEFNTDQCASYNTICFNIAAEWNSILSPFMYCLADGWLL
jgi:hypothetical protein